MKRLKIQDWITIIGFFLTPLWANLIDQAITIDSQVLKEILPYIGTIGVAIYLIAIDGKKIKKLERRKRYLKLSSGETADVTVIKFLTEFSEKELKNMGFKEDEINALVGASDGNWMSKVVPHYKRYLKE